MSGLITMLGLYERSGTHPGFRHTRRGVYTGIVEPRPTIWCKPWVAKITGRDLRGRLLREFLLYRKDYLETTRSGDLVKRWYVLAPGVYEVKEVLSLRRDRRYFVRSAEGISSEITRKEVETWLDENGQNAK